MESLRADLMMFMDENQPDQVPPVHGGIRCESWCRVAWVNYLANSFNKSYEATAEQAIRLSSNRQDRRTAEGGHNHIMRTNLRAQERPGDVLDRYKNNLAEIDVRYMESTRDRPSRWPPA